MNLAAIDIGSDQRWRPPVPANFTDDQAATDPACRVGIEPCTFYEVPEKPLRDYSQKMLVGIVLGFAPPSATNRVGSKTSAASVPNANGKRPAISGGAQTFHKIMTLGDYYPGSNTCFAVVLQHRNTFYEKSRRSMLANTLSLGGVIGFYEPKMSQKYLGETTLVISDFSCVVFFTPTVYFQRVPMQMSDMPNKMVHFRETGANVVFGMAEFLTGGDVPCFNVTCDRQLPKCTGCMGTDLRRNVVMKVVVEASNMYQYNQENGRARFVFRSWRFTKLVAPGIVEWSMGGDDMVHTKMWAMRTGLLAIERYVNANGGWTILGWHRRGILDGDNEDARVNTTTAGHIVSMYPTCLVGDQITQFDMLCVRANA